MAEHLETQYSSKLLADTTVQTVTIQKILTPTDVGERSHQSRISISLALKSFFASEGEWKTNSQGNSELNLDFEFPQLDVAELLTLTHYNNKERRGTRNELRLSRPSEIFASLGATVGQTVRIQRDSQKRYKMFLIPELGGAFEENEVATPIPGAKGWFRVEAPDPQAEPIPVRSWLALASGKPREIGLGAGWDDRPDSYYSWDSTVPCHDYIAVGDRIVIWDGSALLGLSVIDHIEIELGEKTITRCPDCNSSKFKNRETREIPFRCSNCKSEFKDPSKTTIAVTKYRSSHEAFWIDAAGALSASQLRSVCLKPKSQHSFREMRWESFTSLINLGPDSAPFEIARVTARSQLLKHGHRLAVTRVRVGQAKFREKLIQLFGSMCAITGPTPSAVLEACHLYSYADHGRHHESGGLLLRRDIHRLFDRGAIRVNPESLLIAISPELLVYPAYAALNGSRLMVDVDKACRKWLRLHWEANSKRGEEAQKS